jgi:hypothetical protein
MKNEETSHQLKEFALEAAQEQHHENKQPHIRKFHRFLLLFV